MEYQSLNLEALTTETNNERTRLIDSVSTLDMINMINNEDRIVAEAVGLQAENIAKAVDKIAESFKKGGRLIYCGAGTSGRLGVLDASECPPTFGTPADMVQGYIAGGDYALRHPIEGAEDSFEDGQQLVRDIEVTANDVVVGITASGRTKYVLGAIEEAKSRGAFTVGVCTNQNSDLERAADLAIAPMVGSEVVQGSTRLKSGTAQKMVLNMLTTGSMIKIGKVYQNYMVDMKPSNEKLVDRSVRLTAEAAEVDYDVAYEALKQCDFHVKTAIVMIKRNCSNVEALALLEEADGYVAKAIELEVAKTA